MKLKLTDWYSGHQKPVRVGVYQREYPWRDIKGKPAMGYCWWNSKWFSQGWDTKIECVKKHKAHLSSIYQSLPWRGVMK